MNKKSLFVSALITAMFLPAGAILAADQDQLQDRDQTRDQLQDQDRIYGSQLMTNEERLEYRNRMRAAKTIEERAQIRNEHHERMKIRAREQGVTLPDEPPYPGGGMGPGPGGMGPGGGRAR
jgi:hypothetical protein